MSASPQPDIPRPLLDVKQTIALAVGLGVVAAIVVWWLRRFEVEDMHRKWEEFLSRQAEFEEWYKQHRERGTQS